MPMPTPRVRAVFRVRHATSAATTPASSRGWSRSTRPSGRSSAGTTIAASALARLRGKLTYRPVVFELLPETFTLTQLQVTVAEAQVEEGERITREVLSRLGGGEVFSSSGLSRLALVGRGMHQRPGVYARAFRTLLEQEIDVSAVSTSGISINLWIPGEREAEAVAALHDAFTLELAGQGPVVQEFAGAIFQRALWSRGLTQGRYPLGDSADQALPLLVVHLQPAAARLEAREILWLDVCIGSQKEQQCTAVLGPQAKAPLLYDHQAADNLLHGCSLMIPVHQGNGCSIRRFRRAVRQFP